MTGPSTRPAPGHPPTAEHARLAADRAGTEPWTEWGPYVSGRQWGTVREDYSADGDAWSSFPFDHAHARAYRWGEDGLAGLCDRYGFLNLALALWNGNDDRLKERYFGLTNGEGNHGEDVKEYWWHLDATPTHSYAQWLYRYPQARFPYAELRRESSHRTRDQPEYELSDTGVLDEDRFFDIRVTHAKADPRAILVEISATNHGPDPAPLHLLPQLWFRNTWSWGRDDRIPRIGTGTRGTGDGRVALAAEHGFLGRWWLLADGAPRILFCDNETDVDFCFGTSTGEPAHPKNAVDRAVVHGDESRLAADGGTKAALWWSWKAVAPGATVTVRLVLVADAALATLGADPFAGFDATVRTRRSEADAFYDAVIPGAVDDVDRHTARRAFAGLLWGRQLYRYDVEQWLEGDPAGPEPPAGRWYGRNSSWRHVSLADVVSMPDEWEYPWFASWDLAFHCVALAHVDPGLAKDQLVLMCREWAMHPDGQLPAYEWDFGDVNPPVHAWAAWQVYLLDGGHDRDFLVRIMTKLLFNVGWWVNRKDADGSNLYEGGFLGMDNIGPFDRSRPLPDGQRLEQSDATSWMAFFLLSMLRIALELSRTDSAWDDTATKFLEHFLAIADAMERFGSGQVRLWDDADGFFYDVVVGTDGSTQPVRVRSLVGLLPLLAIQVQPSWVADAVPDFAARFAWLRERHPERVGAVLMTHEADADVVALSLVPPDRIRILLRHMLSGDEFLSPHGVRSLSAAYRGGYSVPIDGAELPIAYTPGESDSGLFGGNSNWRGPVWFPLNVLLADAMRTYAEALGPSFTVELPTGSGRLVGLAGVADEIDDRLIALFRPGADGRRPGDPVHVGQGPLWSEHPTFSEYFHGDTGAGLGASHQTGWTALVAHLVCLRGRQLP